MKSEDAKFMFYNIGIIVLAFLGGYLSDRPSQIIGVLSILVVFTNLLFIGKIKVRWREIK